MNKTITKLIIAGMILSAPLISANFIGSNSLSALANNLSQDFGVNIQDIINPDGEKAPDAEIKVASILPKIKKPVIEKKEIIMSPEKSAVQGDTVFVTVKSPTELSNPYLLFKGKKINFYKKEDGIYNAHIGIDAWHKTGDYSIEMKDDTGKLDDTKTISVEVKRYPNQYITLSGEKSTLTATADELRKIQLAKTSLSKNAYFDTTSFGSPTKGCIASVYGLNRYYNGAPGSYHKGVDVAAPKGQAIKSPTGGKVTVAEMFRLHGGTVGIDHGQGITSLYLHMSKINVKPGQIVKAGEVIGEVGSTGISTGPHLHWGLYINGTPVDPYIKWLEPVPGC